MAEQIDYLIIGNGIAGVTAAEILRTENSAATIGVIADDAFPVYYRPALKDYLGGHMAEDKLWARPANFYQAQKMLFLSEHVVGIQVEQHCLQLQNNKQVGYQKLLLANGASAARLGCPGENLQGVTTLRTVADYQTVMDCLKTVNRVVVVGSGTLALETVETLCQRDLQVTHLIRHHTLWSEVLDATASDLVLQQEQRAEVDVHLEEEIVEITGSKGKVNAVITNKGTRISCEMVLIAIGIEPNVDFIRSSNIACGRGVRVDGQMRTNARDIYAVGDVVETSDEQTGRTRVIGQWYPAIQQARAAAYSMLGVLDNQRLFQASTFYNASFLYGLDFASVGITSGKGYQEIVAEPKPLSYRKVLLKDGIPVGMLSLGDRKQALAFKRAIDHRVNLLPVAARLFADDFKLHGWLDKQGVPPPLLSVRRLDDTVARQLVYTGANEKIELEEDTMQAPLSDAVEALLVHVIESTDLRIPETVLSQTETTTIGRQAGVYLLIDEPTISRLHAEINYASGHFMLRDVGSSNGTYVNDMRLEPERLYQLKTNDQVRIGKRAKFRFLQRTINPNRQQAQPVPNNTNNSRPQPYAAEATRIVQRQTVLKPDGSLYPPGAAQSVPADVVATFKEIPALVILPQGPNGEANDTPRVYLLKPGKQVTIGREKGNDVELLDVVASRRHAEILSDTSSGAFYIRDLGSSNGIQINQTTINGPYRLSHGDRIQLGSTTIFYVDLQAGNTKTSHVDATPPAKRPAEEILMTNRSAAPKMQTARIAPGQQLQMLICPRCGLANMSTARFCASCSALLE